ncbi:hypothetical protein [Devosia sp. 2618]|uniref:hypothetical protein n=1 Tax=Devosia sp. 2618 TaxID=3156454 RepID=UPI003398FD1D
MADYKELLRRAISALPENNGAARRAVYEKARSALVGQLRAINPPLPARDITQHRLQLEDCIRQVEQEASEAVISLGRETVAAARPIPMPPIAASTPPPAPAPERISPAPAPVLAETPKAAEPVAPTPKPVEAAAAPVPTTSIEDIISQAAASSSVPVTLTSEEEPEDEPSPEPQPTAEVRSIPSIVARAEASKQGPSSTLSPISNVRPLEAPLRAPSFEPRRDSLPLAANTASESVRLPGRIEPVSISGSQAVARQSVLMPVEVSEPVIDPALSSVREVDVERDTSEAEGVIASAIETLDREARGESTPFVEDRPPLSALNSERDDAAFAVAPTPPRSGSGLTIFLVVFAILLAGVGGAGFWAWREGYVDLDQMFGRTQVPVTDSAQPTVSTPTLDPVEPNADAQAAPGNTVPTTTDQPNAEITDLQADDRLEPTPQAVQPTGNESVLPDVTNGEIKSEERLQGEEAPVAMSTDDPAAQVDPAVLAGSQSLLLEASQNGTTGAVPFSGTVEWTEGVDELGLPTLKGAASIPARNLGVDITIRKNSDPSLPASHLMEVNFNVSDTFIGGTIANLPGVLLKDQELVPGTALVGASARVVGNSFLFALSATPGDATNNTNLLENRKWMDLAVVYGTGRNAIITLEKDDEAQELFKKVFTAWAR